MIRKAKRSHPARLPPATKRQKMIVRQYSFTAKERMDSMKERAKRKMAGWHLSICLSLALVMCALWPGTVRAERADYGISGGTVAETEATFTIDNSMFGVLGYGPIVSIPVELEMEYSSSDKAFEGEDVVYCSGVVDEGKKITVEIDDTPGRFGTMTDSNGKGYTLYRTRGFSATLDKQSWTKDECLTNLEKLQTGDEPTHTGSISVTVPKNSFIPYAPGKFTTYIPYRLRIADDN